MPTMTFEQLPIQVLFYVLYGVTGTVSLVAAIYLLLRRGNAFAADVNPPLRLRRWAASFFIVSALSHVWWLAYCVFSTMPHSVDEAMQSVWYVVICLVDETAMFVTITGTLHAMLQDRRRPMWPAIAAIIPFVILGVVYVLWPSQELAHISLIYLVAVYVAFTIYIIVAVGRYGRWLRANYGDIERKEVAQTHVIAFLCLLLIAFYSFFSFSFTLLFILHLFILAFEVFMLWRVETLPQLDIDRDEAAPVADKEEGGNVQDNDSPAEPSLPQPTSSGEETDEAYSDIEALIDKHCVNSGLYLQHDVTLEQLARIMSTNRTYLSRYFSSKGTNYNTYINDLRIAHFIELYRDAASTNRAVTLQQLAQESGYHSYSTFSAAFKNRMGLNVSAWVRNESANNTPE